MKAFLKNIARKFGYDILHLPTDPHVRQQLWLLEKNHIDLIFDIGANQGQFANKIRGWGYKGRIVSFEPLPQAFHKLKEISLNDNNWEAVNTAIGNFDGYVDINISQNSYSSSILGILPLHVESAPDSIYVGKSEVPITKLDTIINKYYNNGQNLFVKVDTQGYEKSVIDGCENSLYRIKGFQMELSIIPLYKGEILMQDMVDILRAKGFKLMLIEGGHCNYITDELLQVECIFYRQ